MNKNFALIGAAGYIAPTHMRAIIETGNYLRCALDKNDSVGVMDQYSKDVDFFTEFERFDRHIEMLNDKIDYVSICSPNYLHDSHVRFALRIGAHAICEKPLVLNLWNLDALQLFEEKEEKNIYNILQMRLHPAMIKLKNKIKNSKPKKIYKVVLTYIAPRGRWYDYSWKGSVEKSGGIAMNIGIHLFDLLIWIFGKVESQEVYLNENRRASGFIELKNADVSWYLSINKTDIHYKLLHRSKLRSMVVDNEEIDLYDLNYDLHVESYIKILKGNGFTIKDVRQSIQLVNIICRYRSVNFNLDKIHPYLLEGK